MTTARQRSEANVRAAMPRPIITVRVVMTRQQFDETVARAPEGDRADFQRLVDHGLIKFSDEP